MQAVGAAAVDEAGKFDAGVGGVFEFGGQGEALFVHAHNEGALLGALEFEHHGGHEPQAKAGRNFGGRCGPEPGDECVLRKLADVAGGITGDAQEACDPDPVEDDV